MKHLVILGSVWPEPNSSAAGTRMCQLIELFQRAGWRVTFASAALPSEHRVTPTEVTEAVVALNSDGFDQWLAEQAPDAVLFDRFMTEEQFGWRVARTCPDALRILDTEDLHCLRAARWALLKRRRVQSGEKDAGPLLDDGEALFDAMVEQELTHRELASIYRSDWSLMVSGFEASLLRNQFGVPETLFHVLPIFAEPLSRTPAFEARSHFVSIGNFRHAPNWDAVLWLKHELWPRIRSVLPNAELHIYGAYPPPKATALNQPRDGFLVKGWVDDALGALARARVCLAPLRFGAGIKGKLLDAMAAGTPSVTSSIGCEAMGSADGWPGQVEDTVDAFCEAAVSLYRDRERWLAGQQQAPLRLREHFDRNVHEPLFRERLSALLESLVEHRKRNVTGAMLRLHQHRSTQYMSQWIEAKNRLKHGLDSPEHT